ncbi:MAG: hypothetical protein IPP88_04855 [Betaproteobacteria bacterium]|nr:hypothetical protein [Betaproteobacteria bacterium]
MKRLIVFSALGTLLLSASLAGAQSAAKPVILKPGKPHEKCMVLDSAQKIEYRFESSAKVNFNLHYNKGDAMYFPVKLDRTKGESGLYEAKSREKYCLVWENRTDADVELNYSYKVGK